MQTRSWEKDGQKQYRTEIIMDRFEFGPNTGGAGAGNNTTAANAASQNSAPVLPDYPEEEINPEDIPF